MIGDDFDDVLGRAKRRDSGAVEQLYRDTVPLVLGYLRSQRVRDADDVASEVFVSMIKGLPGFTGDERSYRSWLLTIAHHRMVDSVRRSQRRPEGPESLETVADQRTQAVDGEAEALAHLESRGILAAMDDLTPDQRAVVMLRVLGDLSIAEISRVLGKPQSAVKALLRRGFGRLRRTVAAERTSVDP